MFLCLAVVMAAGLEDIDEVMTGLALGLSVSTYIILFQLSGASDQGRDGLAGQAPTGLFYNSEILAEFSAIIFVWCAARQKFLLSILAIIPVVMCDSRIALLTCAAGLLYAYRPKQWWKTALIAAGIAVAAVAMVVLLGQAKINSADHRFVLWVTTVFSWTQFGQGLGWFRFAHPIDEMAHSDILQIVAELGVGAFVLAALPVMAFFRNRGTNAERAAFLAVCFQATVSFPFHFPASGFVAAVLAGFLLSSRPLVWLGQHVSGTQDGFRFQRQDAAHGAFAGAGGRGSESFPARSVFAFGSKVRSRENSFDPKGA